MRFAKLHGLGNDFVLIDARSGGAAPSADEARALCDRHFGIGADGVLTLLPAADGVRLVIHNADGSQPEMCGNGARVAALWVATRGCHEPAPPDARVRLQTDAGLRVCTVTEGSLREGEVEVAMGVPRVEETQALSLGGATREMTPASMGNPHRVIFVEERGRTPMEWALAEGERLCRAENANVEFARPAGPQRFDVAVWERGSGLTLACGTGACAVAAVAFARGKARRDTPVEITLPGGALRLTVSPEGQMLMRGPAALVFHGDRG